MPNIVHVELSDTFNKQRQTINALIDYANSNPSIIAGNGLSKQSDGLMAVKTSGDALSFDGAGNLVGNDAYPNLMTQVVLDPNVPAPAPTVITSTTITFPAFSVIFDNKVYYGKKISDFTVLNVPETVMTVESGEDGAVFVYVDSNGDIQQSMNRIAPGNSSEQCLLGSYFRLSNQIQSGSWAYTPWNGSTSKDTRFSTNGAVSGGLINANSASTLSRTAMAIMLEGVNASTSVYDPNNKMYADEIPYSTKKLWPGYDASVSDSTTIDTTHIYNITDETVDDISSLTGYIVLIPGIVAPTGQDVYLMAMSPKTGSNYSQVFASMSEAAAHIYSLQVSLGNVASRVLWLNQSIIVKIGATDLTDPGQLRVVGEIPNALGIFAAISSGGAGSRVTGLTIKSAGATIGNEDSKTTLNFQSGFTVLNTSENSVSIYTNLEKANSTEVDAGVDDSKYITASALAGSTYLTEEEVEGIIKHRRNTVWPSSTDPDDWPHTLWLSLTGNYIVPSTLPTISANNEVLTWEVVLRNMTNGTVTLTWPSVYQSFNTEILPASIQPNTSLFLMMRKYSNNFALVSVQGNQGNSLI